MKGNLRDVIEIAVDDDSGDRTYRTTCTIKIGEVVYVLHAFPKKATLGVSIGAIGEQRQRIGESRFVHRFRVGTSGKTVRVEKPPRLARVVHISTQTSGSTSLGFCARTRQIVLQQHSVTSAEPGMDAR